MQLRLGNRISFEVSALNGLILRLPTADGPSVMPRNKNRKTHTSQNKGISPLTEREREREREREGHLLSLSLRTSVKQ